ncbi:PREDICTED: uncharacterized protein LOC104759515 [Camelina sativa]|uniref:Uncharacterized protein LOC104759515 n=1 Tax=Camelina sativa TaxID=90675 RepID=A0ABM0X4W2_CAMSA|nr:PREDICTED: uncharacterized protein LOC104759515 [Camelina sativa]
MIRHCGLLEFPAIGDSLSWRGWRDKKPIRCRLDRALANEKLHDTFSNAFTEYLPMVASDHKPVLALLEDKARKGRSWFRFDRRWLDKEGLFGAISEGWDAGVAIPMGNFMDKIIKCRQAISKWRKAQVPYGRETIEDVKNQLAKAQSDDSVSVETISELNWKLREAYRDEEIYWYQKSRSQDSKVQDIAVSYFLDLFTSSNPSDFEEILGEVGPSITGEINDSLTRPATEQEIKEVLFMMHPDKAPGPDGMTALFYQRAWDTVRPDLTLLRLRSFLPTLISETQSAFVEGRLITDNILIAQEMFHGLRTNPSCKGKFMAIKTDMSKAYDRVEWSFIEHLLRKFGFCEKWISWVMWCVTSVQYKVLINGQPHGAILPSRGLRQGDPLSPYLFILCTEVLIANLRKAERSKLITGIKVSTACPAVSHLLFADDSLFFCRATKEQCEAVLGILRQYERASGQQINFQKSSVQFGHTVDADLREELKGVLGITNLGGMSSYLGIPESLGGSKTKVFSFVQDRLQKRTGGWPARLLSRGGKEVMIKSVAIAVPTFVMSCFRLPKTVTRKLTSAVSNFWWSASGDTRGLHWIAWDKLCVDKIDGGLGFRCLDDFNTALLAKQLWRLISAPDALFAKVFKGRYYRHSNPLDPIKSYSPSYGWRSMVSARSLVNKGLIKRVGSGDSISVWSDPWIPAQPPRPALRSGSPIDPTLRVETLIDRSSRSWNLALLSASFKPEDVAIISALPIGKPDSPDMLGWHLTKTGLYTVKSGYNALRQNQVASAPAFGPNIIPLQAFVWKIRCPPKIRHFLWQAITGCIATTANLRRRGMTCDPECGRCGCPEETINHALFLCPPAWQVWALSSFPTSLDLFPTESIYTNMDYLFWRSQRNPSADIFPWILWYIWKARNDKILNNLDSNPLAILQLAEEEAKLWSSAQADTVELPHQIGPHPNTGPIVSGLLSANKYGSCFRCFVDGSWKVTDQYTGRGWYCISPEGESPTMGASNLRRSLSPLHAEVEALIWAMRCMIGADNENVVFLTDCSDLVKMVSSPSEWPAFKTYLDEIEADKEEFLSFSLVQVPRTQNGSICNFVAALTFAAEAGVFLEVECFEQLTNFKNSQGSKLWMVNAKPAHNFLPGEKVSNFKKLRARYFFVRVDGRSFENPKCGRRRVWNDSPVRPYSARRLSSRFERIKNALLSVADRSWTQISRRRVEAAMGKARTQFASFASSLGQTSEVPPTTIVAAEML